MIELPREGVEFVETKVTVDGCKVTTGLEVSTTTGRERPSAWQAATILDGKAGILVDGLPVGEHLVWVRIVSAPETPVVQCDRIRIT